MLFVTHVYRLSMLYSSAPITCEPLFVAPRPCRPPGGESAMIDHVIVTVSEFERSKAFYMRRWHRSERRLRQNSRRGRHKQVASVSVERISSSLSLKVRQSSHRSMSPSTERLLLPVVATTACQSSALNITPSISQRMSSTLTDRTWKPRVTSKNDRARDATQRETVKFCSSQPGGRARER